MSTGVLKLLLTRWSAVREFYPPAPTWSTDAIPDMTGKVVIVTGGYAGIGKETVKSLLEHNAKVYIAGRSETRARLAIEELKLATGGKEALFLYLDLASLRSVRESATKFQSVETELHILYNNAGVQPEVSLITQEGYDLQFGIHVIGHHLFTKLLLPTLISTAKFAPGGHVRVINISSIAEANSNKIDYATLKDGPVRRSKLMFFLYSQSKAGNILFSQELAKRYGDDGIVSIALHPGAIHTELQRRAYNWQQWLMDLLFYNTTYGALTQLYAGTAPEAAFFNGKYMVPWARVGEPYGGAARDPGGGEKLWDWLEDQTKDF